LILFYKLFFLFLFFSVLCEGKKVRIASYNVKNYLSMDRLVSGRWVEDYPKPEIENGIVRSIIRRVNPDILALQEIGPSEYLNDLWCDLNNSGIGQYQHAYWLQGEEDEKRHLALLSRIPFKPKKVFHELEFSYFGKSLRPRRGLMEVEFLTNGKKWRLFNLHLKSKWTERKDDPQAASLREKEARAIRDYIRQNYPPETNPMHLVLGDFNDFKNSAAIRRFQRVNKTTLNHILPCKDTMGYFWTHYYKKQDSYDRIDYIFTSPAMREHTIEGSARVADQLRCLEGSDHRMIFADFEF
jgi:endonuclease/exonuclease/phosphatase family metal-dependent hydrolase